MNWTLGVRDILKILWKRGELLLGSNFSSFPQYFYMLLDFHVKQGTRFSLRDKRLFKTSEFEIAGVNCISTSFAAIVNKLRFISRANFMLS